MWRADSFAAGGTASSRSNTTRSAPYLGVLVARSARFPGTNSRLRQCLIVIWGRSLGPTVHQGGAATAGHELVALVVRAVFEDHDSLSWPGTRGTGRHDLSLRSNGVAVKDRNRKLDVGESEVRHGGSQRGLEHGETDEERQREHAVDEASAELTRCREGLVEMERLRIHGEKREQGVVGFGHCFSDGMVDDEPGAELFEPSPRHRPAVAYRLRGRLPGCARRSLAHQSAVAPSGVRCAIHSVRNWCLTTFPVGVFGNSSKRIHHCVGNSKWAKRGRRKASRSSAVALAAGCRQTMAPTSSPRSACGRPTTATSSTSGCSNRFASTWAGAMFSPPRMIRSLARPVTYRNPWSSIHPRSPVRSHPSASRMGSSGEPQ